MLECLKALRTQVVHLRIIGKITEDLYCSHSSLQVSSCLHSNFWRSPALFAVSVNSSSGCLTQARLIRDQLLSIEERWQCPVYTFAEDIAVGPGYLVLTAGKRIFADNNSVIGGLYVSQHSFEVARLSKSLGVEKATLTKKKINRQIDPFCRQYRTSWIRSQLQTYHKSLLADVFSRRGGAIPRKPTIVTGISNGKVFLGESAVEAGLVDSIGDVYGTVAEQFPGRRVVLYEAKSGVVRPPLEHVVRRMVDA